MAVRAVRTAASTVVEKSGSLSARARTASIISGTASASMVKYWTSDLQNRVIDDCLQLFGGYGYMNDYLIGRMYVDARIQRIYGGANEIMKEVIARAL